MPIFKKTRSWSHKFLRISKTIIKKCFKIREFSRILKDRKIRILGLRPRVFAPTEPWSVQSFLHSDADWLTDACNVDRNRPHIMHSMQPKSRLDFWPRNVVKRVSLIPRLSVSYTWYCDWVTPKRFNIEIFIASYDTPISRPFSSLMASISLSFACDRQTDGRRTTRP